MNNYNKFITFLIVIIISGCSTYEAQYKVDNYTPLTIDSQDDSNIKGNDIETSIFLIGDAGDAELGESTDGLSSFENFIKNQRTNQGTEKSCVITQQYKAMAMATMAGSKTI